VFTPGQAIAAALAGATYVAPFMNRTNDIGRNGIDLIRSIVDIFKKHSVATEVLGASILSPMDIVENFLAGADVVTASKKVFSSMISDRISQDTLADFLEGWTGNEI